MKAVLHRITANFSMFWRYFSLLAVVVCLFLGVLTLSNHRSARALENSYLEQAQAAFYANCDSFSQDLLRARNLLSTMEDSEHFISACLVGRPQSPAEEHYLSRVGNTFQRQCTLLNLPGECFLYFRHAGSLATRYRFFRHAQDCFDSYLMYDDQYPPLMDQMEAHMQAHPVSSNSTCLLPATPVRVDPAPAESYLTLLVYSTRRNQIYGFLYSAQSLLDCFQLDSLPADTSLELTANDGTVLFSHNVDGTTSQNVRFSAPISSFSATATITIPLSYFRDIIHRAQSFSCPLFLVSLAAGLALCVLFSLVSVHPFRRLIRTHAAAQGEAVSPNELVAIDRFLTSAREKNTALRSMLLSSLLARSCSGQPIPPAEQRALSAALPIFHQSLYCAILRDRTPTHNPEPYTDLFELLRSQLPGQFLCEYLNMQECILLFQAEPAALELLQCVLLDLNKNEPDRPRFVCGVSTPFSGVEHLSSRVRQARFCVPEDADRIITLFSDDARPRSGSCFDLKQFQQNLSLWNWEETLPQLDELIRRVGSSGSTHPEELFYSILHLLRENESACIPELDSITYRPTDSPVSNLCRLRQVTQDLFSRRQAMQQTEKQQLREELVRYVREHFSDDSLCLISVAQQFCVSERFVRNVISDETGMSFSSYLSMIRMEEAARLLKETDEPINIVSEKCGYPVLSTFYRNFRKHFHVSPVEYKDSLRGS